MCTSDTGVIYCPDFSSDPGNCGGCGKVCAQPANGSSMCSGGGCVVTCNTGYQPDGNGGCVSTICPNGVCPAILSPNGACYWLDCSAGGCCWDLNGSYAGDPASCQALDSCSPGGGGGSSGGCYKWSTSSC